MNKNLLADLIESYLSNFFVDKYIFLDGNITVHADSKGMTKLYSARLNDNSRGSIIYLSINIDTMSDTCYSLEDVFNYLETEVVKKQLFQYETNCSYKENKDKVIKLFYTEYLKGKTTI